MQRVIAGRFRSPLAVALLALPLALACRKSKNDEPAAPASASASPSASARFKLTKEQSQQVLARVGERVITLGDYVAALERMDSFERLRYQSADRRKLLLKEMIDVELLAEEARRRGLDKLPETEERLRQMLRDELMKDMRQSVPSTSELPEAEVRKYYEEHKDEFNEPERRRLSHIALPTLARAKELLPRALKATPAEWGELVRAHSRAPSSKDLGVMPVELSGDLGIVGPPGHPRGANPRVSETLRAAAFKIAKSGEVYPEVIEDNGKFEILRLTGITEPRSRSFEEAQRSIRVSLVQRLVRQREESFEKELRERYPVTVDEAALSKVKAAPSAGAPRIKGG